MKCIVCDKCKEIIKNHRLVRVITCARPMRSPTGDCVAGKPGYRGNDRQQNDIIWEKEICDRCMEKLEAFFEADHDGDAADSDATNISSGGEMPANPEDNEETYIL